LVSNKTGERYDRLAFVALDRFNANMTFTKAFEDVNIAAATNPRVAAHFDNMRSPRRLMDERKRVFIIDVSDRFRVRNIAVAVHATRLGSIVPGDDI
jgi:hypothetical protein